MKPKLEIQYIKSDKLKPWPGNPKNHDMPSIINSVERFDITQPILVQKKTNRIIAGHGRLKAFQKLGIEEVPVIYLDMDDKAAKAYMLVDNQLTIQGGWDDNLLKKIMDEVKVESPDIHLEELGFEDILETLQEPAPVQEDDFEPPAEPKNERGIKLGDVYLCGKHRVMCGDATKADDVARLMDGKKADMVFTDPPYAVGIGAKNRALDEMSKGGRIKTDIENDNKGVDETAKDIWEPAFTNIATALKDGGSYYVTAPQGGDQMMMMMMMMKGSMPCRHELIWVKNQPAFSMGRLDYDYKHEPILYGWKGSHNFYGKGEFTKSVWEIDRERKCDLHPTMKPVKLVVNAILNSSLKGEVVADFFGGSGTTLIASEETGRTCHILELTPEYTSVILDRWEALTGKKATLISP